MYAAVDCRSAAGTVLLFEIEETGWWVRAEAGEDFEEMPVWPDWETRCAR